MQQHTPLRLVFAFTLASCATTSRPARLPLAPPVHAVRPSELSSRGRPFALIVNGDGEPRHVENVEAARRALIASGVIAQHIVVLSGAAATRKNLTRAVARLRATLGRQDRLVVYFTGHGAPDAIVLGKGQRLSHDELIRTFSPLRRIHSVFVFDGCYSGALPWRLVESGFRVEAMAPAAAGKESYCQFFAPYFWRAIERHLDVDGDGKPSFREAFAYAMQVYHRELAAQDLPAASGSFAEAVGAAKSVADLRGPAIVMLTASWCPACHAELPQLEVAQHMLGEGVRFFTVDVEKNPLPKLVHGPVGALPTLLFVERGRVRKRVIGARPVSELVATAHAVFPGASAGKPAIVRALRRALRDPERARFAILGLLELDAAHGAVRRAFEAKIERLQGAARMRFLARVSGTVGYASLVSRLSLAARQRLVRVECDAVRERARRAAERIASDDERERARGWFGLWQLTGEDLPPKLLLAALPAVTRLKDEGDAEQRRIAAFMAKRLTDAVEARHPPAIHFSFAGNARISSDELRAAVSGHSLSSLVAWGSIFVKQLYATEGFRDAKVSPARFSFSADSGLVASFEIHEGPVYSLASLRVVEMPAGVPPSLALHVSKPRSGPLDYPRIGQLVQKVIQRYRDAGHYLADAEVDDNCDASRRCAVSIRVEPGPVFRLGKIELERRGDSPAHFDAARFATAARLRAGSRYSDSALLAARKRILMLPEVSDVAVSTKRVAWNEKPDQQRVDVHIEITLASN